MRSRRFSALALSMLAVGCGAHPGGTRGGSPPAPIASVALRVVSGWDSVFVLDSTEPVDTTHLGSIIREEIQRPHFDQSWAKGLSDQEHAAAEDLLAASRARWPVDVAGLKDDRFRTTPRVIRPLGHEFGFVALSPVGFNKDSSLAAIVIDFNCGNMCATASLVFLARTAVGGWQRLDDRILRQE